MQVSVYLLMVCQASLWKSGIGNATYVHNGREPAAERHDGSSVEKMTVHFDFDNSYARSRHRLPPANRAVAGSPRRIS